MKKFFFRFLTVFLIVNLSACHLSMDTDTTDTDNFSEVTTENLKHYAKKYSEEELQDGSVPLNEYIQISGEIIQSDSKTIEIEKGDRFILMSGQSKYQVFNEQDDVLKIGDLITVYGEYYGFLKGSLIEKDNEIR